MPNFASSDIQTGVKFGCKIANQSIPDGTVLVTSGGINVAGVFKKLAPVASIAIPANTDVALPQKSLVWTNDTPTVSVATGVPGDLVLNSVTLPSGVVIPLGSVILPPSTSIVDATTTQDARLLLRNPFESIQVTNLWYGPSATTSSNAWTADALYLVPWYFGDEFLGTSIGVNCTVAGTAGTKGRLGLYTDDGIANGTLYLVADTGQTALDTTGQRTISISEYIGGQIWLGIAFQSTGATKPTLTTTNASNVSPNGSAGINQTSSGGRVYLSVSGALPSTLGVPMADFSQTVFPCVKVQG